MWEETVDLARAKWTMWGQVRTASNESCPCLLLGTHGHRRSVNFMSGMCVEFVEDRVFDAGGRPRNSFSLSSSRPSLSVEQNAPFHATCQICL